MERLVSFGEVLVVQYATEHFLVYGVFEGGDAVTETDFEEGILLRDGDSTEVEGGPQEYPKKYRVVNHVGLAEVALIRKEER